MMFNVSRLFDFSKQLLNKFLYYKSYTAVVLKVVDGDTIKVLVNNREVSVRLFGIDAPEVAKPWLGICGQPYGKEAKDFLGEIVKNGETIYLHPQAVDKYGRTVALVSSEIDSVSFNQRLIENGLAWYDTDGDRFNQGNSARVRLRESYNKAQKEKVGIWANIDKHVQPKKFRQGLR